MKYTITHLDKETLLQHSLEYRVKLILKNNKNKMISSLNGIVAVGNLTIDSDSDIRRQLSFTISLDEEEQAAEKLFTSYIGNYFSLEIGIFSFDKSNYIYYPAGDYLITDAGTSYHSRDNSISFQLSDRIAELNGTINGQLGAKPETLIPVEKEDGSLTTIQDAIITFIRSQTNIERYIVNEVGELNGFQTFNENDAGYREENVLWNKLPYDLTFDAGCTVYDILTTFRDLYPNYQVYMDVYGSLCFDMVPSCEHDMIVLDNDFLQQILLSEQVNYDRTQIRNITEVFGKCHTIDRFAADCQWDEKTNTILSLNLSDYKENKTQIISLKFQEEKDISCLNDHPIKIEQNNTLYELYHEYSKEQVTRKELKPDTLYSIKYHSENAKNCFYFLGEPQPHAICVLSDDEFYQNTTIEKYIADKFDCTNIFVKNVEKSPFSIQRLGPLLDVKYSGEFDNITSDTVALTNAKYYNERSTMMFDTITLTTKLIPFLDVQQKITYQKQQDTEEHAYVTKSISHDFSSGTSTITLYRFYPLITTNQ